MTAASRSALPGAYAALISLDGRNEEERNERSVPVADHFPRRAVVRAEISATQGIVMAVHLFFYALSFGLFAFVPLPAKDGIVFVLLGKFVFGLISLLGLFQFFDLLLFKEVQLYEDRIVKVWTWIGARAIKLASASLTTSIPGGRYARTVCNQGTNWYSRGITGIFYYEDLADPKEVKKLNSLLAYLSGRKLQEIEYPATLNKLIKEGDLPRSASGYVFNEDLLNQDPGEREFLRIADVGLLLFLVIVIMTTCLLWYPLVRKMF